MSLTKDDILRAPDIKTEKVEVPEWGGSVHVRTMTGAERDAWESRLLAVTETKKYDNLRATLVAMTCSDENGNRLFSDGDIEALGRKSAAALGRIYDVALRVNALTREAREELLKNSEPSPGASSVTD